MLSDGTSLATEHDWSSSASSPTEEVDHMQVSIGDEWHREMDHQETACGLVITIADYGDRRPSKYEGCLCMNCYTPREVARAMAETQIDREDADAEFDRLDQRASRPTLTDVIARQTRRRERVLERMRKLVVVDDSDR